MYSNKKLRFLVVVFLVFGLIPIILVGIQPANSDVFLTALRGILISCAFATTLTILLMKINGDTLEPIWLTVISIVALYLFCSTVASFVPFLGMFILVILGWGLSTWLLELPARTGVLTGIVFYASMFLGGLISTLAGM